MLVSATGFLTPRSNFVFVTIAANTTRFKEQIRGFEPQSWCRSSTVSALRPGTIPFPVRAIHQFVNPTVATVDKKGN